MTIHRLEALAPVDSPGLRGSGTPPPVFGMCGGAGVGQVTESAIGGVAEHYPVSGCSACSDAVAAGRVLDGVGFNSLGAIRHLAAPAC